MSLRFPCQHSPANSAKVAACTATGAGKGMGAREWEADRQVGPTGFMGRECVRSTAGSARLRAQAMQGTAKQVTRNEVFGTDRTVRTNRLGEGSQAQSNQVRRGQAQSPPVDSGSRGRSPHRSVSQARSNPVKPGPTQSNRVRLRHIQGGSEQVSDWCEMTYNRKPDATSPAIRGCGCSGTSIRPRGRSGGCGLECAPRIPSSP